MPTSGRLIRTALFFLALAGLAGTPAAWAAGPSADAYVGYSRLGKDAFYPNVGGLNGWQAAIHVKLMPFVGVEGDVSRDGLGAPSATPRTTMVLVGPRVTVGTAGIHIFAHGLIGGEHSANSSGSTPISGGAMAIALGGGADFRIAPFLAWRVTGDYVNAPFNTPGTATHSRFGTGLVFRF